jgi:hypothetical protein
MLVVICIAFPNFLNYMIDKRNYANTCTQKRLNTKILAKAFIQWLPLYVITVDVIVQLMPSHWLRVTKSQISLK